MPKTISEIERPTCDSADQYECPLCYNLKRVACYKDKHDGKPWYHFSESKSCPPKIREFLDRYDGRCRFCWVILEGFWMCAQPLGYVRSKPCKDFDFIEVNVKVTEKQKKSVLVSYETSFDCEKECPAAYAKWQDEGWIFTINEDKQVLPWSHFGTKRPEYSSRSSTQQIQQWLDNCSNNHNSACNTNGHSVLPQMVPTRLLEIGPSHVDVRLIETGGILVQYTGLSYCWGGPPKAVTKVDNYAQRLRKVDWSEMPRLHQDAVKLTWDLGVRHIWIDAWCIIQNDEQDWNKEAVRMADVYENAHVVFSSAHAPSADEALIAEDKPLMLNCPFQHVGDPDIILAWSIINHKVGRTISSDNNEWPAFERAWTFQERMLSRRVVHFAPKELIWECRGSKACECGYLTRHPNESLRHMVDVLPEYDGDEPEIVYAAFWRVLLRQCSGRKLSEEKDRLVAISGLAQKFNGHGLGRYFAGIWENDMPQALTWWSRPDTECRRTHSYVAPTWSWASIVGETWHEFQDHTKSTYHAVIEDVDCTTTTSPFSRVESGYLKMRSPVYGFEFARNRSDVGTGSSGAYSEIILDVAWENKLREVEEGTSLLCSFVWTFDSPVSKYLIGVLLKRTTPSSMVYRRVGLLLLQHQEKDAGNLRQIHAWLAELPRESVTIV